MNDGRPPTRGDSPVRSGRGGNNYRGRGSGSGRGRGGGRGRGNDRARVRGGDHGTSAPKEHQCYNCKDGNHLAKDCTKPCNDCHSTTHTTTKCPVRLGELMKAAEEDDRVARTQPSITCTYCQSAQHTDTNCQPQLEMRENGVTSKPAKSQPRNAACSWTLRLVARTSHLLKCHGQAASPPAPRGLRRQRSPRRQHPPPTR
jgi:hypothetical protein